MKINIIGAGVAGLSAGCYLQMNGFETTIFERHSTCGGLCTSWKRNGYTFESGMQWLLGSGKSNPFYQLWSELIDMDSILFVHHDVRMEIEVKDNYDIFGDKVFHLFTNLTRLEKYLISIAPEDESVIRQLIHTIRRMQSYEIPPLIKSVPELLPWYRKIRYIKYLPLLIFLNQVKRETNFTFAEKLKNPFLKEAFRLLFDGDEMPLLILTMPLAFNDLNGTGYPIGGSIDFVGHIEKKYIELGGKIRYQSDVKKIVVENNHAKGVLLSTGEIIPSGITVSAADWNFTIFKALEGHYVNQTILELQSQEKLKVYYSVFMVSLGVAATFPDKPHFLRFPLPQPLISPDGSKYERMEVHINNYDPTSAPEGKTVISISYYTRYADYWIDLRHSDQSKYESEKNNFARLMIDAADEKFHGLKEKIEEVDIATPATFQRYTNNWKGSVQGWLPGKNMIAQSPVKTELPGLKDFYLIGHWTIPGGGLPVAIKSARDVAQMICHQQKTVFKTPSP
ncbi:MAG: NAD(P)/FAD-dependent oxidoreductase [Bacteroidetes bacterium]|nr:NAD(P)/FAD-dependent oxidoreductase [Bacteroidota bacterium]